MKLEPIETIQSLKAKIARQSKRNIDLAERAGIAERRERDLALENARLRRILKEHGIAV